jgi:hypothetical protein
MWVNAVHIFLRKTSLHHKTALQHVSFHLLIFAYRSTDEAMKFLLLFRVRMCACVYVEWMKENKRKKYKCCGKMLSINHVEMYIIKLPVGSIEHDLMLLFYFILLFFRVFFFTLYIFCVVRNFHPSLNENVVFVPATFKIFIKWFHFSAQYLSEWVSEWVSERKM